MTEPIRIVALLSGGGTTLENIFDYIEREDLPAVVDLVVSSKADAYGLERARNHNVDTAVVESKEFRVKNAGGKVVTDWAAMSSALNEVILPRKPDLICFAGFSKLFYLESPT
jgi:folate-dependent phosphoribosylglycinamide formyltransferase PurN